MQAMNPHKVSTAQWYVFLVISVIGVVLLFFDFELGRLGGWQKGIGLFVLGLGLLAGLDAWQIREIESSAFKELQDEIKVSEDPGLSDPIRYLLFYKSIETLISRRRLFYRVCRKLIVG